MGAPDGRIFSSWKEIAEFLGKGVRTVQRWEKTLGLPIRRPNGTASNVVVATESELRRWAGAGATRAQNKQVPSRVINLQELEAKLSRLEQVQKRLDQTLEKMEERVALLQNSVSAKVALEDAIVHNQSQSRTHKRSKAPDGSDGGSSMESA